MSTQKLKASAKKVMKQAYSPYSKVQVGVALELKNGEIVCGCNIENASYGGTVCAERVAIWKALSDGHTKFKRIFIISNMKKAFPPCGFCRQVLAEFCPPDMEVIYENIDGESHTYTLNELLPHSFGKKHLK